MITPSPLGFELRIYSGDNYFSIEVTAQEAYQPEVWIDDMKQTRRLEANYPTVTTVTQTREESPDA